MDQITYFILVPMVYLAVLVFVVGVIWRIVRARLRPAFAPTLQIFPEKKPAWLYVLGDAFLMPTVRRHNPVFWVFLMAFHICLLLLVLGHLELIREFAFIQVIGHEIFLGGGFVGLIMLVSLLVFLVRRWSSPTKELSVPEDYFLLVLLFLTVLFGSQMDWARTWYGFDTIAVDEYRSYLWSLVTFQPEIGDVLGSGHTFMLVLHILCANLVLILFPFTKLMHAITIFPANKLRRG